MEADSVNSAILSPEANEETVDLFVREVFREMTTKAGQKCTAIRRAFVPENLLATVQEKLTAKLAKVVVGDPQKEETTMGALASIKQKHDVAEKVAELNKDAKIVLVATIALHLMQIILKRRFFAPTLLVCEQPLQATNVHTTEAFGPVCTLMPYQNIEELADLVSRGEGSLVASVVKNNDENIEQIIQKLRLGMVVCMYSMQSQQKKVQVMVHHFHI